MANRTSLQEAEQVKAEFESRGYKNIVIIDKSYDKQIKPEWKKDWQTVVRELPKGRLLVHCPSFDILQKVTCQRCSRVFHTRAIGELGNNVCVNCEQKAIDAQRAKVGTYESKQSWAERFERE